MIGLEWQIGIALLLDLGFGDPRWFPHPVRLIGGLAGPVEDFCRSLPVSRYLAGVFAVLIVLLVVGLATAGLLAGAEFLHPLAGMVVAVFLCYTAIALKDLAGHSRAVYLALQDNDLEEARRCLGFLVGRDTAVLDEQGVIRACVESVSENIVDGVTAPLFYAALGGPVAAMLYKGINTLDSTYGYRNERYAEFGWAAARLDDAANYIPARLTALLVPLVSAVLPGFDAAGSVRIFRRDRHKHASPNSGQIEAAAAGALGIQVGGLTYYQGRPHNYPTIGDRITPLAARHILLANRLLYAVTALSLPCFLVLGRLFREI